MWASVNRERLRSPGGERGKGGIIVKRTLSWLALTAATVGAILGTPELYLSQENWTVCPSGCPFSSVQAALDAAPPGALVRVLAGTYQEALQITRPVRLQGDGQGLTILQGPPGSSAVLEILAPDVVLSDLTVAGMTVLAQPGSEIRLVRTTVDHQGRPYRPDAIEVLGAAAELDRVRVLNGETGLFAQDESVISIQDSDLGPNAFANIRITNAVQATIRNSRIHDAPVGIDASARSQVFLEGTQVYAHRRGVVLWAYVTATLARNRIYENALFGVASVIGGHVLLQENVIENNGRGVEIGGSSWATLTGNLVEGNEREGVVIRGFVELNSDPRLLKYTTAVLVDNAIRRNGGDGLQVWNASLLRSHSDAIEENGGDGLLFLQAYEGALPSQAEVWEASIVDNGGWGVALFVERCHPGEEREADGVVVLPLKTAEIEVALELGSVITGNGKGDLCVGGE